MSIAWLFGGWKVAALKEERQPSWGTARFEPYTDVPMRTPLNDNTQHHLCLFPRTTGRISGTGA
jgi:hypothetical protein